MGKKAIQALLKKEGQAGLAPILKLAKDDNVWVKLILIFLNDDMKV